jgi:DNA topoisomerase-1
VSTTTLADLRECRLSWSDDKEPGLSRVRAGKGFSYRDADGHVVRDAATLGRVRALAVPPAWTDVWLCAQPDGHLQATGRDARGRKQYRYHPRFQEHNEQLKFEHLAEFGRALPRVRRQVAIDLSRRGLPREKVIATVVSLLESTLIRVGNEEYAQSNKSFGLTTLRRRHARVERGAVRFQFRGKSGLDHEVAVTDLKVRRVIRQCQDLPGQLLFRYVDEEGSHAISSQDVNEYLRAAADADITAKEFRTWVGTVLSASDLAARDAPESERDARRSVTQAVTAVSHHLGNTPAVCRRSYVHPAVIEAFRSGDLAESWTAPAPRIAGLSLDERRLLALLEPIARSGRVHSQAARAA